MQAILRQKFKKQTARRQFTVEAHTGGREVLAHLATEWQTLCAEGPCDQPFFRPEWIGAYLQAFAPDKKLVVVTARLNGKLRAVLPLIEERAFLHGLPVRKLRSPSNVHSCRFDLIHGATDDTEAIQGIWNWLKQKTNWDVIELEDVPEGGACEALMQCADNEKYRCGKWEKPASPYLAMPAVEPEKMDETLQLLLRSSLRKSLRKDRRKLEAQGPLQLVRLTDFQPAQLAAFYQLEAAGWKGKAGTAIACAAQTKHFYDQVASFTATGGEFSLYSLVQNGHAIAMQYCLTSKGFCYLLKPTYDEQFSQYSPGSLLMEDILRDLLARGFWECDFMSPPSEWKKQWANGQRTQSSCYIFRRGLLGQALHAWKFQIVLHARQLKQNYQAGKIIGGVS